MNFSTKLFYDTATEGNTGGGNAAETIELENKSTEENHPPADLPKPILSDEDLKNYGFDSPEALKTFLQKQKEANIPEEQKREQENLEKTNFLKYSAENKLLNVDEYSQFETLKNKSNVDLVKEKHIADYKIEHPEIEDEDELLEAAQEDFEFEYKLKSTNEATKKRGEAKLLRDAKELRNPIETKVSSAQETYKKNTNELKAIKETYPKFESFVDDAIKRNAPGKAILYKAKDGENEVPIEIDLTEEDYKAMAKEFKTPKTFQLFTTAKPEEITKAIDKKMQGWVKLNKFDEVAAKSFETGRGIGTKNGSNIGAENPFALKRGENVINTGEETLEESNARLGNSRKRYKNT